MTTTKNHRVLIVASLTDGDPTPEQLKDAVFFDRKVSFFYTMPSEAAAEFRMFPEGTIEVKLFKAMQTKPGAFLLRGVYYHPDGQKPLTVDGMYYTNPVSGFLDLGKTFV